MASAVCDVEAGVFATPQPQAAATRETPREWNRLTAAPVIFASQDAMRMGPRSYTPEQRLVIDGAVANRTELSAPRLRRG